MQTVHLMHKVRQVFCVQMARAMLFWGSKWGSKSLRLLSESCDRRGGGPSLTGITGQPAYQQIAHDLRRKIADGVYPVGEAIPATNQLMSLYHGSITVVRAAIRELQNEGVLIGQPGKGVYVQRVPTGDELSHRPDTYGRVVELEEAVRELTERLGDGVASDLADIRRQLGVMQSQIMELYGRMGLPYNHDAAKPQDAKRSKSA